MILECDKRIHIAEAITVDAFAIAEPNLAVLAVVELYGKVREEVDVVVVVDLLQGNRVTAGMRVFRPEPRLYIPFLYFGAVIEVTGIYPFFINKMIGFANTCLN